MDQLGVFDSAPTRQGIQSLRTLSRVHEGKTGDKQNGNLIRRNLSGDEERDKLYLKTLVPKLVIAMAGEKAKLQKNIQALSHKLQEDIKKGKIKPEESARLSQIMMMDGYMRYYQNLAENTKQEEAEQEWLQQEQRKQQEIEEEYQSMVNLFSEEEVEENPQQENQVVEGQPGNQVVEGQPGNQVVEGQPGNQVVEGQPENQTDESDSETAVMDNAAQILFGGEADVNFMEEYNRTKDAPGKLSEKFTSFAELIQTKKTSVLSSDARLAEIYKPLGEIYLSGSRIAEIDKITESIDAAEDYLQISNQNKKQYEEMQDANVRKFKSRMTLDRLTSVFLKEGALGTLFTAIGETGVLASNMYKTSKLKEKGTVSGVLDDMPYFNARYTHQKLELKEKVRQNLTEKEALLRRTVDDLTREVEDLAPSAGNQDEQRIARSIGRRRNRYGEESIQKSRNMLAGYITSREEMFSLRLEMMDDLTAKKDRLEQERYELDDTDDDKRKKELKQSISSAEFSIPKGQELIDWITLEITKKDNAIEECRREIRSLRKDEIELSDEEKGRLGDLPLVERLDQYSKKKIRLNRTKNKLRKVSLKLENFDQFFDEDVLLYNLTGDEGMPAASFGRTLVTSEGKTPDLGNDGKLMRGSDTDKKINEFNKVDNGIRKAPIFNVLNPEMLSEYSMYNESKGKYEQIDTSKANRDQILGQIKKAVGLVTSASEEVVGGDRGKVLNALSNLYTQTLVGNTGTSEMAEYVMETIMFALGMFNLDNTLKYGKHLIEENVGSGIAAARLGTPMPSPEEMSMADRSASTNRNVTLRAISDLMGLASWIPGDFWKIKGGPMLSLTGATKGFTDASTLLSGAGKILNGSTKWAANKADQKTSVLESKADEQRQIDRRLRQLNLLRHKKEVIEGKAEVVNGVLNVIRGLTLGFLDPSGVASTAVGLVITLGVKGVTAYFTSGETKKSRDDIFSSKEIFGSIAYDKSLVDEKMFDAALYNATGFAGQDKMFNAMKITDSIRMHAAIRQVQADEDPDGRKYEALRSFGYDNKSKYGNVPLSEVMEKLDYTRGRYWREDLRRATQKEDIDYTENIIQKIMNLVLR